MQAPRLLRMEALHLSLLEYRNDTEPPSVVKQVLGLGRWLDVNLQLIKCHCVN
jgi:hypothetical protein